MNTETIFETAMRMAKENEVRLNARFDPFTRTVDFGFSYGSFTRSVYFREEEIEQYTQEDIASTFGATIRRAKKAYDKYFNLKDRAQEEAEKRRDVKIGMILQSTEEGAKE